MHSFARAFVLIFSAALLPPAILRGGEAVEFNRDVRPILSDHCFQCHGPDQRTRQAGLRLDVESVARQALESGATAIVAKNPDASEVWRRITSTDAEARMPPAETGKKLTAAEIELVRRWIDEGAGYESHWSLLAPRRASAPEVHDVAWPKSAIDRFVLARLEREGLRPSPEAEPATLIRRVTLDLTGLPPSVSEIDAFLADTSQGAYESLVDRLLQSPRHGERMAQEWLDVARYADTHGFNNDTTRYMWRWRDWVIDAFNGNMPFDRFVIEQLAGDLLPNPTLEQRIATGFNRNHVINSEGGIIPEEYRVEYVADRVHTTATVFMGLSVGCARCHDHKFDPITQREFYQLFAFFNNLAEQGEAGRVGNAEPLIKAPTSQQIVQLAALQAELAAREAALQGHVAQVTANRAAWEATLTAELAKLPAPPVDYVCRLPLDETAGADVADAAAPDRRAKVIGNPVWAAGTLGGALQCDGNTHVDVGDVAGFERDAKFSWGAWIHPTTNDAQAVVARMDDADAFRGWDLLLAEGKLTAHLIHRWPENAIHVETKQPIALNQWQHVMATFDGSSKAAGLAIFVNGVKQELEVTHDSLSDTIRTAKPLHVGRRSGNLGGGSPFKGLIDDVRVYGRQLSDDEVLTLAQYAVAGELLAIPSDKRTSQQQETLERFYLDRFDPRHRELVAARADAERLKNEFDKAIATVMVMQEMPEPRQAFVLRRGQYDLPDAGQPVSPGVPQCLPPLPAGAPSNRLGLAQWLVSAEHPLTSRVMANRLWQMVFGTGLVETMEDFGSQGEWPSHPELLDWLATELVRGGWDLKAILRQIVTSATYRQSSRVSRLLHERDPRNRLLARGPRFRLSAETIRDQALAASGLLIERPGGPSVSPYQPDGLWDDVVVGADYEGTVYKQDHGEGLYRRSMYTFWKRTCPPPGLNTFDAPEREVCTVRRARTNTPLQALVLLNDPTYLEAARALAERVMAEGGETPESRATFAFRVATARPPRPAELELLVAAYRRRLEQYRADPAAAEALVAIGERKRNEAFDVAELAAWTTVANMILNLDEMITKG